MTEKEYDLLKEFVQALIDESIPTKMNGKVCCIMSQESIEKMLGRVIKFIVEEDPADPNEDKN